MCLSKFEGWNLLGASKKLRPNSQWRIYGGGGGGGGGLGGLNPPPPLGCQVKI